MVALSDLQLAMILDEIASAMRADLPVLDVLERLRSRRLGRAAKVSGAIAAQLDRGQTLPAAVASVLPPCCRHVSAAVASAEQSGDPVLLEKASASLRRRFELTRQARLAWIYPLALAMIGYSVGVWMLAPMIVQHHGRDLQWPAAVLAAARTGMAVSWIPLALLVGLAAVMYLWRWRIRITRPGRQMLFCDALADQLQAAVPEEQAIRYAAELAREPTLLASSPLTLDSRAMTRYFASAAPRELSRSDADAPHASAHERRGGAELVIARLRYLALINHHRAQRRAIWATRWMPRAVVLTVGGGMILIYAVFVIAPVYQQVGTW